MSWTRITTGDAITLNQAHKARKHHTPTRKRLRKICATCRNPWGRHGCALYLWATHTLSRMSKIIIPNPPPRPKHRHRPQYIKLITQGAQQAQHHYPTPQPHHT